MRLIVYQQLSTQAKALFWASLLSLIYLILIVALPPSLSTMKEYNLSGAEFRVLAVLAGIPTAIVWFASFLGYASLTSYAEKVGNSREGRSFAAIARGLKWLAWSLPVTTCVATFLGGAARLSPDLYSAALILSHYISLLMALFAFTFMGDGTRGLHEIVNKLPSKLVIRYMVLGGILLAVIYSSITLSTARDQQPNSYHLPLWLILLTIIIPYLYAWLMGFFAVFEIGQYRRSVRGLFYKNALGLLASGTTLAIMASVALQYLTSSSPYLRSIHLNWNLLFSYIIIVIFALGFILIHVGANRLKKLEEV